MDVDVYECIYECGWLGGGLEPRERAFLVRVNFFFSTKFDLETLKWRKNGVFDQEMAFLVRVNFFFSTKFELKTLKWPKNGVW